MERDRLRIVTQSPYPLRRNEPAGVKEFIIGIKPHLERKGCSVTLFGPSIRDRENNLVLPQQELGRPVKFKMNGTNYQPGVVFTKSRATELIKKTNPHVLVMHEPLVPNSAHVLISAAKRIKDGQIPVMVGQFHARIENLDGKSKGALFLGKNLRRITLGKYGVPHLTDGFIKTVMEGLDSAIAVSEATKVFWNSIYPREDFEVIYNGIDTEELTPEGPRKQEWLEDGKKIILFAGRHDPRKGIDDLIMAFEKMISSERKDIKLKITGEGEMTGELQELVKKLDLQNFIEFVGVMPRAELIKAYRTADLLVAPSIGGEGFNRTIAEAKSCGTLVVCTDIDGQREAIGESLNPFMAKPRDPEGLAVKIAKVLDLPKDEKQRLQREGRKDVEQRFAWDIIADKHVRHYERELGLRKTA